MPVEHIVFLAFFWVPLLTYADLNAAGPNSAERCVPHVNSCGFYICEEKRFECGPKGYPIAFGNKFCNVFLNTEQEYSNQAEHWLQRVRVCLMRQLQVVSEEKGMSCGGLRDRGFRSHFGCYVETGFCELELKDKIKIGWAMKKSFLRKEVLRDGFTMKRECAKKGLNLVIPNGPR